MNLAEEDFLLRALRGAPTSNTALKCTQLAVLKLTWILPLKPGKQHLPLQTGILA
jgi:hypothetical protein